MGCIPSRIPPDPTPTRARTFSPDPADKLLTDSDRLSSYSSFGRCPSLASVSDFEESGGPNTSDFGRTTTQSDSATLFENTGASDESDFSQRSNGDLEDRGDRRLWIEGWKRSAQCVSYANEQRVLIGFVRLSRRSDGTYKSRNVWRRGTVVGRVLDAEYPTYKVRYTFEGITAVEEFVPVRGEMVPDLQCFRTMLWAQGDQMC